MGVAATEVGVRVPMEVVLRVGVGVVMNAAARVAVR